MKKVLFATTALVATAGVASADIALSGSAEMGIAGGEALIVGTNPDFVAGTPASETVDPGFWTHVDITFTASGTADNGLTFGASVDLDEAGDAIDGDDGADTVAIFISGELGTLTMGDTDGALDWAMTEVNLGAGSINDAETAHAGFDGDYGDTGRYLRYDYSFGDFGFAISVSPDENWAVGAKYDGAFAGGTFGVGIGYQDQVWNNRTAPGNLAAAIDVAFGGDGINERETTGGTAVDGDGVRNATGLGGDVTVWGISASVALDMGFSAAVTYTDWEFDTAATSSPGTSAINFGSLDATHMAIGVAYEFDAITVAANYGEFDIDGLDNISGYGLTAAYDFGGGLSAHLGYGYSDWNNGLPNTSSYSFGLAMSF